MPSDRDGCADCRLGPRPGKMAFQPILDLRDGRVFAYEALVRGADGSGAAQLLSQVTPAQMHGFDQACRELAVERASALGLVATPAALSLNFLPNAMRDGRACMSPTLAAARRFGLAPARLILEITEGEAAADPAHLARLAAAHRELGLRIALDDFGTQHSNLDLLLLLRPEIVKLDMGLVRGIDSDPRRAMILRHCLALCNDFGIALIAEGVETQAEYDRLRELGVQLMQGYFFAMPALDRLVPLVWPR